ncbi:hypothetical protein C0Q70_04093 [Pomacea canaliculata]|uniref:Poly [ADP-ribose] polymerase n=1 Tax=Pomacea canaliculata TaxID=400727 RepID=A0A2T7PUL1_POMCA|nr:hypothetical protein C0Q70_04093 [Pomacea canaliculata]
MRWKCCVCTDYDLCTPCYYADRHDRTHPFLRYTTEDSKLVRLPPRSASNKQDVHGLVKGAVVVRGPHWRFENQDDVIKPDQIHLKQGDKVIVDVDLNTFQKLHKEHSCGWNDGMKQCLSEVGTIVKIPHSTIMQLQYEDARVWNVIRHVLNKVGSFQKGGSVQIIDSYNAAVELQVGHGGWNDRMEDVLGKLGKIMDIDGDGDLKVEVDGKIWLLNPVSCTQHFDINQQKIARPAAVDVKKTVSQSSTITERLSSFHGRLPPDKVKEYITAAFEGDLEKVKAFVTNNPAKVDSRADGRTALHLACNKGHLPIVQFLLGAGANKDLADDDGDTPLHYAADGEKNLVLEELCKQKAKMDTKNKNGLTALHIAVSQKDSASVDVLVNFGADVNVQDADGDTAMHEAIKNNDHKIIKCLLKCEKLDGSKTNKDGQNIMHVAAIKGNERVVEKLIKQKQSLASVTCGPDDFTPLHLAAINGRTAVAGMLIKQGNVQINAKDKHGRTPLHHAVHCCNQHVIDVLLSIGADVNIQDEDGNTAAHLAQMPKSSSAVAEGGDVLVQSILCMLAECGADLGIRNKFSKTPLDLCKAPEVKAKLKGIADKVKGRQRDRDDIPPHWTTMDNQELLVEALKPENPLTAEEYKDVKQKFHMTMSNADIVSIRRIQNRTLWDVYHATKRTMERKYGLGAANELALFHGTSFKCVEAIQHQNIDPLLAGENVGTIWGKGAYFAIDAKISDNYASSDDDGYRYMFMARVLTGQIAQGARDLKRPPPLDSTMPNALADAVVDDMNNPRVYVVFRNQQIYPEFLIQYT